LRCIATTDAYNADISGVMHKEETALNTIRKRQLQPPAVCARMQDARGSVSQDIDAGHGWRQSVTRKTSRRYSRLMLYWSHS